MKNKGRIFILAVVGIFLWTTHPYAQEGKKVGVLNLSKLFESYEKTKEYQKQLDNLRNTYQKELTDRQNKIKEAEGKLAALKEEEKAKALKEIEDLKNGLTEFVQTKRTDLMKQEEEKTRDILLEMEKIISDYAKKEGFQMIINDRVLLYSDPAMDVTEPVMKLMNESYNKK